MLPEKLRTLKTKAINQGKAIVQCEHGKDWSLYTVVMPNGDVKAVATRPEVLAYVKRYQDYFRQAPRSEDSSVCIPSRIEPPGQDDQLRFRCSFSGNRS